MTDDEVYESEEYRRRGLGLLFGVGSGCMIFIAIFVYRYNIIYTIFAFGLSAFFFFRGRYLVTLDLFPEEEEEYDGDQPNL